MADEKQQSQASSGKSIAQTDIKTGEKVIPAGESVSASDVGGKEELDRLVAEGAVGENKPVFPTDPVVGAVGPSEEDMALTDEDTKDAKSHDEVVAKAAEKAKLAGVRSHSLR